MITAELFLNQYSRCLWCQTGLELTRSRQRAMAIPRLWQSKGLFRHLKGGRAGPYIAPAMTKAESPSKASQQRQKCKNLPFRNTRMSDHRFVVCWCSKAARSV